MVRLRRTLVSAETTHVASPVENLQDTSLRIMTPRMFWEEVR